jgi:hypothetical protein
VGKGPAASRRAVRRASAPVTRRGFLLGALFAAAAQPALAASRLLWPGAPFSIADRDRAIQRGLKFIYRLAKVPKVFEENGEDLLWCFYSLAVSASDPWLRDNAWRMGQERSRVWRRLNPGVPPDADADDIAGLVFGALSAERLGFPDAAMKAALTEAAKRFTPVEYLQFDPASGVIPDNVTKPPECDRSMRQRAKCDPTPERISRYELLLDALTTTYSGDHYGVRLGANLPDVMALVPGLRPYRGAEGGKNEDFTDIAYAITHVVYALNDYGRYRVRPEWLPQEFAYLKENLEQVIKDNDPETMGEFIDSLKAFGLTEADPLIRTGMSFIMRTQHADGSWGDRDDKDPYTAYHSTWTAINGLMDYAWSGEGTSFPEALRRVRGG